jgi:catechol 2,3-dioxygenase-like lactoylglutathione lyase family enzyme
MCLCRKYLLLILGCLFVCTPELTLRAKGQNDDSAKVGLLGSGNGIDHVGIAVRDLEAAKNTYRNLGFTVFGGGKHPDLGTRNSGPGFESGYLELITVWDRTKPIGGMLATFLEKHEGGLFLGLDVSPADETAKLLRANGFNVRGPEAASAIEDPEQHDQPPNGGSWRFLGFPSGPIPAAHLPVKSSDAMFFLQYDPFIGNVHANTAKKLSSVWMGVKDLEASVRAYETMGFHSSRKLTVSELGAHGQEIEAGKGSILLLQPENSTGKVASFLAERGAEGIMGVSIEVASLQTARTLLEAKTKRQFETYSGPFGQSILIPPEFTHGIWIEFFQK